MRTRRAAWLCGAVLVLTVMSSVSVVPATRVGAAYTASATGSGKGAAITLATPPAPTVSAFGLLLLTCTVSVSWPAPPAGQYYTILRIVDGNTATFRSNQTSAGNNVSDTFVLPGLFARNIDYYIRASLIASTTWVRSGPTAQANC